MDVKSVFIVLWQFLIVVHVAIADVRHHEPPPKTCQQPHSVSGGSLNDMVGNLFPCSEPNSYPQQRPPPNAGGDDDDGSDFVMELPEAFVPSDIRYDARRSQEIAKSVLDLSQRLTENILKQSTDKYEVISPISIASALQLALLGSHGLTFNELMDLMDYNTKDFSQFPFKIHEEFGLLLQDMESNSPNPSRRRPKVPWRAKASNNYLTKAMRFQNSQPDYSEHKISVANGIFVQRDFNIRDEYRQVAENIYRSEVTNLDFRGAPVEAARYLNNWVNEKTNGKIKEIVGSSINPETRVILANALYFNAQWQETFFEGATGFKKFFPYGRDNDYSIQVELMAHGGKFPHFYDAETDSDILGFPYKQNATTMYVILPKNSSGHRLREVQATLTADKLERIIDQMVIQTAVVLFPKMHLTGGYHLKPNLMEMGLQTLFTPYSSDLSVLADGTYKKQKTMSPMSPMLSQRPSRRPIQQSMTPTPIPVSLNPSGALIFNRFSDDDDNSSSNETETVTQKSRPKREVTYKVDSSDPKSMPLTMKDFMLRKRIVKKSGGKKLKRSKRQLRPFALERLDSLRHQSNLVNPQLFAEEVIHKVDLVINEKGTEGGAATVIALNRSGTKVVLRCDTPFMFMIRHDYTRIPLFYGVVFEPSN